jgi:hypothetical protein
MRKGEAGGQGPQTQMQMQTEAGGRDISDVREGMMAERGEGRERVRGWKENE